VIDSPTPHEVVLRVEPRIRFHLADALQSAVVLSHSILIEQRVFSSLYGLSPALNNGRISSGGTYKTYRTGFCRFCRFIPAPIGQDSRSEYLWIDGEPDSRDTRRAPRFARRIPEPSCILKDLRRLLHCFRAVQTAPALQINVSATEATVGAQLSLLNLQAPARRRVAE
jgi:hypothetical protein